MAADRLAPSPSASLRSLSISLTRPAIDLPSALAMSASAVQNGSSRDTLVRCRAMVSERLLRALVIGWERTPLPLRCDHVLGSHQPVEVLLAHMAEPCCLLAQG